MECMDEQLAVLSACLKKTLSPDLAERKQAEQFLGSIERNKNYVLLLLYAIDKGTPEISVRISAAITFKNFVKRNWLTDENESSGIIISDQERTTVKSLILDFMVHSPESVKKQLSDAVAIIGKHDFPDKWSYLLDEIIVKFQKLDDYRAIVGILYTAHSLFKKYRYEFKSQKLWAEIKFVLDTLSSPLTTLFDATMKSIDQITNTDELSIKYEAVLLITKIFYSLNYQDLPEFFEDNMELWLTHFHNLLIKEIPALLSTNDYSAGVLEQIKSQICSNVTMYAEKYEEEFSRFLPNFVTDIWNLLRSLNKLPKYDLLISNALQFLATVAQKHKYQQLFADPEVMNGICEKVIVPNIEIGESDLELFEDNPEEYIRRDIEGSDAGTRRRSACDLVKVLSRYFQQEITNILGPYVQEMLSRYQTNVKFWKAKDAAIYLITSVAAQGQTERYGITQTNAFVNITEFAQNHIIPELQNLTVNAVPIVKATCIKYIMCFRAVLPKEMILAVLPLIIKCLNAESVVVHTYAAATIEKILCFRNPTGTVLIVPADLNSMIGDLLVGLIGIINRSISSENDYAMKAVMRTFAVAEQGVAPFLSNMLPQLINILKAVAKNPSKPNFNHYLFETFALSVKIVYNISPTGIAALENELFPVFQIILQEDVSEFIPYTFQLLAMLLEYHEANNISESYLALYPFLSTPTLWERSGNVYPLVKLIKVYIKKCEPSKMDQILNIKVLLGIFQKLISSRMNDHEGFNIMENLIQYCPSELLTPYMKQIFILLFQRLSSSKTNKFVHGVMKFCCVYLLKYGPSNLITTMDSIQPRIFEMVIEKVIIPGMEYPCTYYDTKVGCYGVIKLITEAEEVYRGTYSHLWIPILRSLLKRFESSYAEKRDEVYAPDLLETTTYDPACSKLVFANNQVQDLLPDIADIRLYFAQALGKLSVIYPGKVASLISNCLTNEEAVILSKYISAASVQLI